METNYIIMSGNGNAYDESQVYVWEVPGYKSTVAGKQWSVGCYSMAKLFSSEDEAHAVAKEMGLRSYSILLSYTKVSG